jgi:hypothetical protein
MTRDFFDPTPEQQNVVLIDAATLHKAQCMIAGCELVARPPNSPVENILDRLTGSDPSVLIDVWMIVAGLRDSERGIMRPPSCITSQRRDNIGTVKKPSRKGRRLRG